MSRDMCPHGYDLREGFCVDCATSEQRLAKVCCLRALIKGQEFGNHAETASGAGDFCPWCGEDGPHADDCPAFTPEGEVR